MEAGLSRMIVTKLKYGAMVKQLYLRAMCD